MAFTLQTGEIKFKKGASNNPQYQNSLNIFTDLEAIKNTQQYLNQLENKEIQIINNIEPYVNLASRYASEAMSGTPEGYANLIASIVSEYDSNNGVYTVGDYCLHNAEIYRCISPILQSENWTNDHWKKIILADDLKNYIKKSRNYVIDFQKSQKKDSVTYSWNENICHITGTPSAPGNRFSNILHMGTNRMPPLNKKYKFSLQTKNIIGGDVSLQLYYTDVTKGFNNILINTIKNNGSFTALLPDTLTEGIVRLYLNTYTEYNIQCEVTIEEYIPDQKGKVSDYIGKKVSIIGDSISTYNQWQYMINGYAQWYPNYDVKNSDQTWWNQVISAVGSELEVNASYSGSRVTNTDSSKPSLYTRCVTNIIGNPDTIFVALGTNDADNSVLLGEYDFDTAYTDLSESNFRTAYIKGIKALKVNYPNANIICIAFQMNNNYSSSIEKIANELNCDFININDYTVCLGCHPDLKGMRYIAGKILSYSSTLSSLLNTKIYTVKQLLNDSIINANLLLNPGTYGIGSGYGINAYLNFPTEANVNDHGGMIITQRYNTENTNFLRQFFTNEYSKIFYTRYKNISGFSEWEKLDFSLFDKCFISHNFSESLHNCNDYIESGIYPVGAGSNHTYLNFPNDFNISLYGCAILTFDYDGNSRFIRQYLIYENNNIYYTRYKDLSGWDDWTKHDLTTNNFYSIYLKTGSTVDANTFTQPGTHGLTSGLGINAYSNFPDDANVNDHGGMIFTQRFNPNNTNFLRQFYTNEYNDVFYTRYRNISGFGEWKKLNFSLLEKSFINYTAESPYDCNNYIKSGIYPVSSGSNSTYLNFPDNFNVANYGCAIITFDYYGNSRFLRQYLIYENNNIYYTRYKHLTTWDAWVKYDLTKRTNIITNKKIALFGDSIMSGTIKTPSSNQTHCCAEYLQNELNIQVVDHSIGSIGYLQQVSGQNILEIAKSVDLTGCTFFVCCAGDNDWRYPIGTQTDTNEGYADAPATNSGATIIGQLYKLVNYLHTTYNDMTIIIIDKPNAIKDATWPMYRRADGQWVKNLNNKLKAFCNYYGCAYISLDNSGMDAWLLNELLEPDNIHFTIKGYQKLMLYIAGQIRKYTGNGNYYN